MSWQENAPIKTATMRKCRKIIICAANGKEAAQTTNQNKIRPGTGITGAGYVTSKVVSANPLQKPYRGNRLFPPKNVSDLR
jgi:hypothetical protein